MNKTIDQTDDAEEARYYRAYLATHDSIREAILRIKKALGGVKLEISEELGLMAELNALEGRKARIEAARQAFSQGRGGISPPSEAEINKIKAILNQIRKLTATAAK